MREREEDEKCPLAYFRGAYFPLTNKVTVSYRREFDRRLEAVKNASKKFTPEEAEAIMWKRFGATPWNDWEKNAELIHWLSAIYKETTPELDGHTKFLFHLI